MFPDPVVCGLALSVLPPPDPPFKPLTPFAFPAPAPPPAEVIVEKVETEPEVPTFDPHGPGLPGPPPPTVIV